MEIVLTPYIRVSHQFCMHSGQCILILPQEALLILLIFLQKAAKSNASLVQEALILCLYRFLFLSCLVVFLIGFSKVNVFRVLKLIPTLGNLSLHLHL